MKKGWLMGLAVLCLLAGCGPRKAEAWLAEAQILDTDQWPENAFTEEVPRPRQGTVDYVIDGSGQGRFAVFIRDISEEGREAYIEQLQEMGYEEMFREEEEDAAGYMLVKGEVNLNISGSGTGMGIQIRIPE